ncbi:flagellar assembly protein FliW [Helicobacter sp. MIT 14-3879]|uniref:flagellar assembly protein FliW n=1 Tax=Helicobacter sp. MIT 14-3879 TaxID=2040649 RepID=UPI000E1EA915|nr:flagellar assembly protein FliW [Helicobacter sp. MIT 14-3879]RDU64759.1 flagellar biosynthesis protein FliW [Helicobacter sp. MIT 14-3879]
MNFEIVMPILGFEDLKEVELREVDYNFAILRANNGVSWSLVNPYVLREDYGFSLSIQSQILLDIKKDSTLKVYCMMILQKPLEDSKINFLSPLVFNFNNKKVLQFHCQSDEYPNFVKLESLKYFVK